MVFVDEFLGSIGVEQETINKIMSILEESAQELDGGKPGDVRHGAFGGSEKGVALGGDTSLAHQHVVDAMTELVAGMKGYRVNVDKWQGDMSFTDEDAGVRLQAITNTSLCTTGTNFHDTPATTSCQAPSVATTGGEG